MQIAQHKNNNTCSFSAKGGVSSHNNFLTVHPTTISSLKQSITKHMNNLSIYSTMIYQNKNKVCNGLCGIDLRCSWWKIHWPVVFCTDCSLESSGNDQLQTLLKLEEKQYSFLFWWFAWSVVIFWIIHPH